MDYTIGSLVIRIEFLSLLGSGYQDIKKTALLTRGFLLISFLIFSEKTIVLCIKKQNHYYLKT